jgi:hypothetical protein
MAHFAHITNGIVDNVIVIDQDTLNTGMWGDPSEWVQTSFNTKGGEHPENRPLRANYAGVGYIYDSVNDVFYAPQPYPSWTISAPTWIWTPPVPMPTDGKLYKWDEPTTSWIEI